VLGDVLEAILRSLEASNNRKSTSKAEDVPSGSSSVAGSGNDDNALLKRPWVEVLAVNRSRWQKKHDDGEKLNVLVP